MSEEKNISLEDEMSIEMHIAKKNELESRRALEDRLKVMITMLIILLVPATIAVLLKISALITDLT
ncbi:MAG: hypothetical protein GXY08_08425 [Ruminococcus sp.]|nr:hypothetical protein [Ruminococcus sp.]